jgi:hypothetical protein
MYHPVRFNQVLFTYALADDGDYKCIRSSKLLVQLELCVERSRHPEVGCVIGWTSEGTYLILPRYAEAHTHAHLMPYLLIKGCL